uniref:Uncharacterized protein n=1 Tax=Zonotrichia albicollis TaxID=44394 RepID=A0A8D2NHM6_ZONAL
NAPSVGHQTSVGPKENLLDKHLINIKTERRTEASSCPLIRGLPQGHSGPFQALQTAENRTGRHGCRRTRTSLLKYARNSGLGMNS